MKHRISALLVSLLSCTLLIGCAGQAADPELSAFKDKVDSFCLEISDLDTSINAIDPQLRVGGDVKYVMVTTLIAVWGIRLPLTYFMCFKWDFGVFPLLL
jgi:hypothetical protein